jgi:hypothetical protein
VSFVTQRRVLALTAVVEMGTGLALMVVPGIVVPLLLGTTLSPEGIPLARVAGTALLALGLASWPTRAPAGSGVPAFRAMLVYNALVALYLTHLATARHVAGLLLWPAVALHAVVALLLVWTWRKERGSRAAGT